MGGGGKHGNRAHRAAIEPTAADAVRGLKASAVILAVTQVVQGAGYIFGSPASAPSLVLMGEVAPIPVWGGLLVIGGLLLLGKRYPLGHGLCALICLVWAVFALLVLFNGTATAWSWPWPTGLATMHTFALYRSMRATQLAKHPAGS